MKTILYFLIPILILSTLAPAFTKNYNSKHTIIIQSTEKAISSATLSHAADIISRRLKDFNASKFDVSVSGQKNQITVILYDDWDIPSVEKLLQQKGELGFYETYNRDELSQLLKGDNKLFTLLPNANPEKTGAKIGCTTESGCRVVDEYINTLSLKKQCLFAWRRDFGKADFCLYALKLSSVEGPVITNNDIDNARCAKDVIYLKLKDEASHKFAEATERSIGKDITIVLDGNVIWSPNVRDKINAGKIEITGEFTATESTCIAAIINNGMLPAGFTIVK